MMLPDYYKIIDGKLVDHKITLWDGTEIMFSEHLRREIGVLRRRIVVLQNQIEEVRNSSVKETEK